MVEGGAACGGGRVSGEEPGRSPFEILGLPVSCAVTRAQIESAYLARIAGAHPDHAADGGPAGEPTAAELNDARAVLLDEEKRFNLVHRALGGPSAGEDDSLPDGFLMEIMDARMEIEEATASGDAAEREKWAAWGEEQKAALRASASAQLERLESDADGDRAGTLRDVRRTLNAWRYYERLIEQLDPSYDPASADFA